MLYKGVLITQASGRLDDAVFSRNRGGPYVRSLGNPNPNPATEEQVAQRAAFKSCLDHWPTLTAEQRATWDAFAADWPTVNRIGDTRALKGIDVWVRHQFYRQHAATVAGGITFDNFIDAPPPFPTTAWDDAWVPDPSFNPATGRADIAIDPAAFPIGDDPLMGILVYAGNQVAPTVRFYKSPMTLAGLINNDTSDHVEWDYGHLGTDRHAKLKLVAILADNSIAGPWWFDLDLPANP